MNSFENEILVVTNAVLDAGRTIEKMAVQGFSTEYKENTDPLTSADLAANRILKEQLTSAFPDYGWLSEETRDDQSRLAKRFVWIVDPIDGTKEFVARVPQYSVSVALVDNGKPVLGAVYNPATDEFFLAVKGRGATLNNKVIQVTEEPNGRGKILGSRTEMRRGEFEWAKELFDVEAVGSIAYKLALVAGGNVDATFSLNPKNEWDIAAGVLLVEEAGGRVVDKAGNAFHFNQENTLVSGIIAASSARFEVVTENIKKHLHQS